MSDVEITAPATVTRIPRPSDYRRKAKAERAERDAKPIGDRDN